MGLTVKKPRGLSVAKTKQKEVFITSLNGVRISLSETPDFYQKNYIGTVVLYEGGAVDIRGGLFERTMFKTAKLHANQCWARNYKKPEGVPLTLNDHREWVWCLAESKSPLKI